MNDKLKRSLKSKTGAAMAAIAFTTSTILVVSNVGVLPSASARTSFEVPHHIVEPNETWESVATQYGITASQLAIMNGSSTNNRLNASRVLHVVPVVTTTTTTVAPTTTTTTTTVAPTTTTTTTMVAPTTTTTTLPSAGLLWSESFDTQDSMNRLVFDIEPGRLDNKDGPVIPREYETYLGDHDTSCNGPLTTRSLVETHQVEDHVWWCAPGNDPAKGHFMTGMNAGGYIILTFSPKDPTTNNAQIFPATANRVCWDQNLTDLGGRKWTQLIIVGENNFVANDSELDYLNPGNNGNFAYQNLPSGDDLSIKFLFSSVEAFRGQQLIHQNFSGVFGVSDKATRYQFCVTDNKNGSVTVEEDRPSGPWSTTFAGAFPEGPRVFLFGDDTYNAEKSWEEQGLPIPTDRFTWHWDNLFIDAT